MRKFLLCLTLLLGASFAHAQLLTVTPRVTPGYFTPAWFGVHAHEPAKANHYPKTPFGSWRTWDGNGAGTWAYVQPTATGGFDFTGMDAYMAQIALTPGTKVLVTLGRTPSWAAADTLPSAYNQPGMSSPPSSMDAWRLYVRTMATRYAGQVEAYEMWNEANLIGFYTGTIPKLVEMSCAAAQEIRAVDPAAKIVSPSGTGAYPAQTNMIKAFLDAGGKDCVDIVSYHLYTSGSPPENFVQALIDVRESLVAAGYGRFPLWNTETGYITPGSKLNAYNGYPQYDRDSRISDYDAADFVVRSFLLARAIGFERFYTYAFDDGKFGHSDLSSGMLREQGSAITRFYNTFTNGGYVGTCTRSATWIWTCNVKIGGGGTNTNGTVVWVDPSAPAQVQAYSIPFTSLVSNFHVDGSVRLVRFTNITISSTPQLLVIN